MRGEGITDIRPSLGSPNESDFQREQIRIVDGRYVDFDTWLEVQRRATRRRVEPIHSDELVHPSQLICQFTDLMARRNERLARGHQLPILFYFCHLGDPGVSLTDVGNQIATASATRIDLFDRSCTLLPVGPASWAWMEKQIRRLEQHLYGCTRPHVQRYLRGFVERSGDARTVGRESIESGGVDDR